MMNYISFLALLIIGCNCVGVISQSSSAKHHMCRQMCELFLDDETSIGEGGHHQLAIGKPGKRGIPGERGEKGTSGPPGVINYSRIDESLGNKVAAETRKLNDNIDSRLQQFERSMELMKSSIKSLEKSAVQCDGVPFDGKCFIAEIGNGLSVSVSAAYEMCKQHGGNLANIYSKDHYNLVYDYVQNKMAGTWTGLWLGMSFDTSTQKALLSNGGEPRYTTWHIGYPSASSTYRYMGLVVKQNVETASKGMHNYPITSSRHGALCEV